MCDYYNYLKRNNYSQNTLRTYMSVLNKYEQELKDIRLLKRKLMSYESNPNTCILHYNVLVSYMKWKKDKRLNDLTTLKLPQVPIVYREVFTKEFLYTKTNIKSGDSNLLIKKKMTVRFLFETGLRASEIHNIISISDEYITIKGKGNKQRSVFYKPDTLSYCLPFDYSTKTLRLWVKEVLGEEYSPHSIRRSFATHMLTNGANPKMVQLQLGHSKIETTFSYLNLSKTDNYNIYNNYI